MQRWIFRQTEGDQESEGRERRRWKKIEDVLGTCTNTPCGTESLCTANGTTNKKKLKKEYIEKIKLFKF